MALDAAHFSDLRISLRAVLERQLCRDRCHGRDQSHCGGSIPAALFAVHEKAIYLHEARQYHVEQFDYKERKAYVKRVRLRLLHGRHRPHAGKSSRRIRERRTGGRPPCARRCASDHAGGGVQEDQVLHDGERRRGVRSQCRNRRCKQHHSGCIFPAAFLARFTDFTPGDCSPASQGSVTRYAQ